MTVQFQPIKAPTSIASLTAVIYGEYKIGKSTFVHDMCSDTGQLYGEGQAEHLAYMHTEHLSDLNYDHGMHISSWKAFCKAVEYIKDNEADLKAKGITTIAIDCIDTLYKYAIAFKCAEMKIKWPSENQAGWRMIADELLMWIGRVSSFPDFGFWMIAHQDTRPSFQLESGKTVTRLGPNLPKTGQDVICGGADMVLWAEVLGESIELENVKYAIGDRILRLDATPKALCGCNLQLHKIPEEIKRSGLPLNGRTFKEAMDKFM